MAAPHCRPIDPDRERRSKRCLVKDGIDATSVEGAVNAAVCDSRTYASNCIHRRSACRCCGGVRSARRHTAYSDRDVHRRARRRRGQGSGRHFARRCSRKRPTHLSALELVADKSGWGSRLPRGKAGEKRGRGVALHEIVQHRRRASRRGHGRRTTSSPSIASFARSTADSRSIRTSFARKWKAASASDCRPRSTARSR
mgnify:CR=1 FL=1